MSDFGLDETDVAWTLRHVHWFQAYWMLLAGLLMATVPRRRFGASYRFIVQTPGGQYIVAGAFITVGILLVWALVRDHRTMMARALFCGGLATGLFGVMLTVGALSSPTGVMGGPFALYVAAHMMYQSELLGKRR